MVFVRATARRAEDREQKMGTVLTGAVPAIKEKEIWIMHAIRLRMRGQSIGFLSPSSKGKEILVTPFGKASSDTKMSFIRLPTKGGASTVERGKMGWYYPRK
jgi:hypothetical protein